VQVQWKKYDTRNYKVVGESKHNGQHLMIFNLRRTSYICIGGKKGVAYRNTRDMEDIVDEHKRHGGHVSRDGIVEAVWVDGDWFKTSNGLWLPIIKNGETLFQKVTRRPRLKLKMSTRSGSYESLQSSLEDDATVYTDSVKSEVTPDSAKEGGLTPANEEVQRRRLAGTAHDRLRRRLASTPYDRLSPADQVIKRFHEAQRQKPHIARLEKLLDEMNSLP